MFFFRALAILQSMARLEMNEETARLYIRIPRGYGAFTQHKLDNAGETRVRQAGLRIGDKVPHYVLHLLDQHHECSPSCHAHTGSLQLQFHDAGFLPMVRRPHSSIVPRVRTKVSLDAPTPAMQLPLF